jgi:Tetratricopeptide Repeats-Sensor
MPDAVAFMVMPFGKKEIEKSDGSAPKTVDFDELWHQVHKPVLTNLGYQAVRADYDVGSLIIAEMIQRLAVADLVIADISIGNPNVYYEIGVRHAAQERGCVLVAADWAEPAFNLGQMRRLRYPLADGAVGEDAAFKARQILLAGLGPLAEGRSPVFDAVPGYSAAIDLAKLPIFQDMVDTLSSFDAEVEAIRACWGLERSRRTRQLLVSYGSKPVVRESAVLELLRLVRDNLGWDDVIAYIDKLPDRLRWHPPVVELWLQAQAKIGKPAGAIGALKELIKRHGPTSERQGLLGGMYKRLMFWADDPTERECYLDLAIEAYEQGMILDLNDYYPISNLSRLYRLRGRDGDKRKAVVASTIAVAAIQRSIKLGKDDGWARPMLLAAAFEAGDVAEADRMMSVLRKENAGRWRLEFAQMDLAAILELHPDPEVRTGLREVLTSLQDLTAGEK